MICFPHCKINLGLQVVGRRADGYHNIETVLYPINWCDALEVVENPGGPPFTLDVTGLPVQGDLRSNILYKAWERMKSLHVLPPVHVHLRKQIPMGAGLGGGSSDGAFFLKLLDDTFALQAGSDTLHRLAAELGSDCAFFLQNKAALATGRGDLLQPFTIGLGTYSIIVIYPGIHSSTVEAYKAVRPSGKRESLVKCLEKPLSKWRGLVTNDFEETVCARYPEIAVIREKLYSEGALYAAMSGSGSAVFGIFEKEPQISFPDHYLVHISRP